MGDKRIYELTKIDSAPGNGVLPIDVPGSEETNGITVDNLAKTMPVATSERNGMMSSINAGHTFIIPRGGEVEIYGSSYCMLLIKNPSSGGTSLLLIGHLSINIVFSPGDIGTGINDNKIVVYKKAGGENCFIKNNMGGDYRIITFVL